jgi:hypothetical protein
MKKKIKEISSEEFDRKFDAGDDIDDYIDWDSAKKIKPDQLDSIPQLS